MGLVDDTIDVLDRFGRVFGRFLLPLLVLSPLWLLESGPVQTARFNKIERVTLRGLFYQADNYSGADNSRNAGTASTDGFAREGETWTVFSLWDAPHGMCSGARHVTRTRWCVCAAAVWCRVT